MLFYQVLSNKTSYKVPQILEWPRTDECIRASSQFRFRAPAHYEEERGAKNENEKAVGGAENEKPK